MKNIKQKHIDLQNDIIDRLKELKKLADEVSDVLGVSVETFENILNFPVWDYNNSDRYIISKEVLMNGIIKIEKS